jgi:drug/metabolite transporter (DMT)-like permease
MSPIITSAPQHRWISAAPTLFVVLWSTGFIGSKYGVPHAEPFTLTALRMGLVVSLLAVVITAWRAPWPRTWQQIAHMAVAGLLVHATYLSGILYAIKLGLPLGFVALIAGLQPVLTALISRIIFSESLTAAQWLGMTLGFCGVVLVIYSRVDARHPLPIQALSAATIALLGITLGTLYQKRFCQDMDLRTGGFVQFAATGLICALLAFLFESRQVAWNAEFIMALFWLAIVLSLGAISLLYLLIRLDAASKVSSLFFLTPSVTALMAWLLFDEVPGKLVIAGLLVSACGVALVNKK